MATVVFSFRNSARISKFIKRGCSSSARSRPLEGIRVLDLSRILAGPYCTMVLGDLGAEIIKVEQPGSGDDTRSWGPPFLDGKNGQESAYFLSVNRNKKSLAVNFQSEEGKSILTQLAAKSDVLVENFVPGKLAKSGLDYETLREYAPRLIYCSITGFGDSGPYSSRAGYDVIAASIGGLLHITGPQDGEPCKVGVAMTDLATGLYAHGAIMAALLQRLQTGTGQKINCDLLSTQVATLVNLASSYLNGGKEAQRWGTAHASIVPYQSFSTKDGYFTIGCGNDGQFKDFCQRLGMTSLPSDAKFSNNASRVQNRNELVQIIEDRMKSKSNKEWNQVLEGAKFPYGPVNELSSVFEDVQVQHNQMVRSMTHSSLGSIKQVGPAVKFSEALNEPQSPPPELGQHTDEILSNLLDYSTEKIADLRVNGVIQ